MEESIWVYIGIISIVIIFGGLYGLLQVHDENVNYQLLNDALISLKNQCDYVCSLDKGTRLSVSIELMGGSIVQSNKNNICGRYKEEARCVRCDCLLSDYELNLNNTFAREVIDKQEFKCFFEKEENGVAVDCQG